MSKRNNIIYWISTLWLSLGMASTGIVQCMQKELEVTFITGLGYPAYLLIIIGIWKLLGVIVVLAPKLPLMKEWAYAGFFFVMSGALFSHLAVNNGIKEIAPALLLLVLTIVSWLFRPTNRKLISSKA
ncbi:MAG: DoxX family protein [Chitinophagaceae bacterium]